LTKAITEIAVMKTIKLTDQEALDLYQALVILMKQLDITGKHRDKNFAGRLEKISKKI